MVGQLIMAKLWCQIKQFFTNPSVAQLQVGEHFEQLNNLVLKVSLFVYKLDNSP